MESERKLREPDNSAACSVVVGDGVGSDITPPKKSQNVYVITARNGVPNSLGARQGAPLGVGGENNEWGRG